MSKELDDILSTSRISGKELLSLIEVLHAQNKNMKPALYCSKTYGDKIVLPRETFTLMKESIDKVGRLMVDFSATLEDIIKEQEQEKELAELKRVLEIVNNTCVDIGLLKRSENWLDYYTRYKHRTGKNTKITEEEFDILKRHFK